MRFRSSFWHKTLNKVSFTVVFIEKMSQTQGKTIYCLNQFLREKHQEKKIEIKIVNKKQPFFFNLCDMATSFDSWNWEIRWAPLLQPEFTHFTIQENLKMITLLLYLKILFFSGLLIFVDWGLWIIHEICEIREN